MITQVNHAPVNIIPEKAMSDELKLGYLALMAYLRKDKTPNQFGSIGQYMNWLFSSINPKWSFRIKAQGQETLRQLEDLGRSIIILGIATPVFMFRQINLVSEE